MCVYVCVCVCVCVCLRVCVCLGIVDKITEVLHAKWCNHYSLKGTKGLSLYKLVPCPTLYKIYFASERGLIINHL